MIRLLATCTAALGLCGTLAGQHYRARYYAQLDGLPCLQTFDALQGPDGRMWFANREGVSVYDGAEWAQVASITRPQRALAAGAGGEVWSLARYAPLTLARKDGERWIHIHAPAAFETRTPAALAVLDDGRAFASTFGSGVLAYERGNWRQLPPLPNGHQMAVELACLDGQLLVGTDRGLVSYSGPDFTRAPREISLASPTLKGMAQGKDRVWFVSDDSVGFYQESSVTTLELLTPLEFDNGKRRLAVTPDHEGGVFVADAQQTLHVTASGEVLPVEASTSLPTRGAQALTVDREGILWSSHNRGVTKLVESEVYIYSATNGLLADEVTAICERPDGSMVLGHEGGLTLFDGRPGGTVRFDADPSRSRVMDLEAARDGSVWIAAAWTGVALLTPDNRVRSVWIPSESGQAHAVAVDGERVWIGGDFGLGFLEDGVFRRPSDDPRLRKTVRSLSVTDNGDVWISTITQGVLRLSRNGELRSWSSEEGIKRSTYGVAHLASGRTLVASSAGLLQLGDNGLERAPESIGAEPLFFVVAGQHPGELWLGTNNGICFSYDEGQDQRVISASQGLLGLEVNRHAALTTSDNKLWVGTDSGLNLAPGLTFAIRPALPRLQVTSFAHGSETITAADGVLETCTERGALTAKLQAISFANEDEVRFRYRIDGYHDAWIGPVDLPNRTLTLPHLGPGEYQLRATFDAGDLRSPEYISPLIVVEAPLTERWWFLLTLAAAGIVGTGLMVRDLLHRRYHRQLTDAVERRTRQLTLTQRELARDRQQLELTLDSIQDAVVATDPMGTVFLWNDAAAKLTGILERDALGRPVTELLPQGTIPASGAFEWGDVEVNGHRKTLEGVVAPLGAEGVGAVIAISDITDRCELDREIARRRQLESVGTLAGGIAHDFNNYLTVIAGTLESLKDEAGLDAEHLQRVDVAARTVEQATSLTGQLLTFSTGGEPMRKATDLAPLLTEAGAIALSGSPIHLSVHVDPATPHADVDPGQIGRVLHNLLLNARAAMPNGGAVYIELKAMSSPLADDQRPWLELVVTDNGPGMPEEVKERAFEPFFKGRSGGQGLGLSVVYNIVKRHHGLLTLQSQPGVGTSFCIKLPGVERPEPIVEVPRPAQTSKTRLLVMDDDDGVRRTLVRMLQRLGHECVPTCKGEDAIAAFDQARSDGAPFGAVLLDLTIVGGLGGLETVKELRLLDPEVRAIAVSGYCDEGTMGRFTAAGFTAALAKPFQRHELERIVNETLGRPRTQPT